MSGAGGVAGTLAVKAAEGSGGSVWTCTQPVDDASKSDALGLGGTSATWKSKDRDGNAVQSEMTWSEPPLTLTEGQEVSLWLRITPWKGPDFHGEFWSKCLIPRAGSSGLRASTRPSDTSPVEAKATFVFGGAELRRKVPVPVTISLSVNPRFPDVTFTRTWTYVKGAGAGVGRSSLVDKTPAR